jgi:hypothetical protein
MARNFSEDEILKLWFAIHDGCKNVVEGDVFFETVLDTQHARKNRFLTRLFSGLFKDVVLVDFTKPSGQGQERSNRLRGYAEAFWEVVNKNSLEVYTDKTATNISRTKTCYIVHQLTGIDVDHHNRSAGYSKTRANNYGNLNDWLTRAGFLTTFRCPEKFLELRDKWMQEEAILREAEQQAHRLIQEENARLAEDVQVVVGKPVSVPAEMFVEEKRQQLEEKEEPAVEPPAAMFVEEKEPAVEPPAAMPVEEEEPAVEPPAEMFVAEKRQQKLPLEEAQPPSEDEDEDDWILDCPAIGNLPSVASSHKATEPKDPSCDAETIEMLKKLGREAQRAGREGCLEYDKDGNCNYTEHGKWTICVHKRGLTRLGTVSKIACDNYWYYDDETPKTRKKFRSIKEIERTFLSGK